MKADDWTGVKEHGYPSAYPVLYGSSDCLLAYVARTVEDAPNAGSVWTHWQPYVPPPEPDTALGLLRESFRNSDAAVELSVSLRARIVAFLANEDGS